MRKSTRLIPLPIALRSQADPRTVRTTTLVRAAEGTCRVPRNRNQVLRGKACRCDALLKCSDIVGFCAAWHWILPDQLFSRHIRPVVPLLRTKVSMRQLEPRSREDIFKIRLVLVEALRDLAIRRILDHRHVGVRHDRVLANRRIFHIGWTCIVADGDRFVLPCAGR